MINVSIIVPIYNNEFSLKNCIESITSQTQKEIQIILINDGSEDLSGDICDEYEKKDNRIEVYHNSNQGVSEARNFGIKKAKGKYIMFVDADDTVDNLMLEVLYDIAVTTDTDLVICGHKSVYIDKARNNVVLHQPPNFEGYTRDFLARIEDYLNSESVQGPCGKLFKTSIVKNNKINFPLNYSFGEDTLFVYKYLSFTKQICATSRIFYSYFKLNNNSLSSKPRNDKMLIYLKLYEELETLMNSFSVSPLNKHLLNKKIRLAAIASAYEFFNHKNITKKEVIENIQTIFSNFEVQTSFKNNPRSIQEKLIAKFISINSFSSIYYLFKLKRNMKKIKCFY